MISVDEARKLIRENLSPLGAEICSIEDAADRILAKPTAALLNQPPFAASAMDGYAVRFEDARGTGAKLNVTGLSAAGERFDGAVGAGCAVRIYTGAPVPDGADHVIIQEHVKRDGDVITITEAQKAPRHIRPAGIDFKEGEALLTPGTRLNGPALALAAAANHARVSVRRRPRIALIANGDELTAPGGAPAPDQIISSIPYGLTPMIAHWGGVADFLGIAPDDPAAISEIAQRGFDYDLIVPIGGASVGDKDYMRGVFQDFGFSSIFEKVSVKPGKPAWFGAVKDTHIIGLPGNPASAMVTAMLFVRPAIEALLGVRDSANVFTAPLATPLAANGPRESYLRARLLHDHQHRQSVAPHGNQDSSLMSVFAKSDVLVRRLANAQAAREGDRVECLVI